MRCQRIILGFGFWTGVLMLAACGGGSGGGGATFHKSSGGGRGIRLLHASMDSAPFSLTSTSSDRILQTSKFSLPAEYVDYPSGEQIISAAAADGTPVFPFLVPDEPPARQSVLVYGGAERSGVNAALIADDPGEIPDGMCAVRLLNGLDGANQLSGSAAGVSAGDGVPLGGASQYVYVPAGVQPVQVKNSRGAVLYSGVAVLESGRAYTLWAAGDTSYFTMVRVLED